MKYRVSENVLFRSPNASTQIKGVPVSLNGRVQIHIRQETKDAPRREYPMRIATQEDLKYLYDQGDTNGTIEMYDEAEAKALADLLAMAKNPTKEVK